MKKRKNSGTGSTGVPIREWKQKGCFRFSYREAGPTVWRRCLDCGREDRGRWVRTRDRQPEEGQP